MSRNIALGLMAAILLSFSASSVFARSCVRLDAERDMLTPDEQHSAQIFFQQLLHEEEGSAPGGECDREYVLFHIVLGSSLTAVVEGHDRSDRLSVSAIEELPRAYSQLIRALQSETEASNTEALADRSNVTLEQTRADERRLATDRLWYMQLGGSLKGEGEERNSQHLGFGWRYELDRLAVDIAVNFAVGGGSNIEGWNAQILRLSMLRFTDPVANSSPYFGGGLAWGGRSVQKGDASLQGSGIEAELIGGYELMRATNMRAFVEFGIVLPLYRVEDNSHSYYDWQSQETVEPILMADAWVPSAKLSFGIGFGRRE